MTEKVPTYQPTTWEKLLSKAKTFSYKNNRDILLDDKKVAIVMVVQIGNYFLLATHNVTNNSTTPICAPSECVEEGEIDEQTMEIDFRKTISRCFREELDCEIDLTKVAWDISDEVIDSDNKIYFTATIQLDEDTFTRLIRNEQGKFVWHQGLGRVSPYAQFNEVVAIEFVEAERFWQISKNTSSPDRAGKIDLQKEIVSRMRTNSRAGV